MKSYVFLSIEKLVARPSVAHATYVISINKNERDKLYTIAWYGKQKLSYIEQEQKNIPLKKKKTKLLNSFI